MSKIPRNLAAAAGAVVLLLHTQSAGAVSLGADVTIGGTGNGNGKFTELRDMAFDSQNNLYTLEGRQFNSTMKTWYGGGRVQIFDNSGKYVSKFSIANDRLLDKDDTQKLSVDCNGAVWVTRPAAGMLTAYDTKGRVLSNIPVPGVRAVSTWCTPSRGFVATIGCTSTPDGDGWIHEGGDYIGVIDARTRKAAGTIKLERRLTGIEDMTTDNAGNFYILAATNQIFKFSPAGKFLFSIGAATDMLRGDGSEPLHSVAVDGAGRIYTLAYGSYTQLVRYDADVTTVWRRSGVYKQSNPWGIYDALLPLAVDGNGRLWVADLTEVPGGTYYHEAPSIMRLEKAFFNEKKNLVSRRNALLLGFRPSLRTNLPYDVSYNADEPIDIRFSVGTAERRIKDIVVKWRVHDMYKNNIAQGEASLNLKDNTPAGFAFSFTPPKWGWYTVVAGISSGGKFLQTINRHLLITREYPGMPALKAGESNGGLGDAPRQVFAGLHGMRLQLQTTQESHDALAAALALARGCGASCFVQIPFLADCTPEHVRAAVTRFKGQVPAWEFCDGPNTSITPEDYVLLLRQLYPIVKAMDPEAKVMGPAVSGVDLTWLTAFLEAGGGNYIDILSVHDEEGRETIDPVHWRWKHRALKRLMNKYGCGNMEIWQTGRAISGFLGSQFIGPEQAVRATLHRDLLQSLGIPPERNTHFFLNQEEYSSGASFVWGYAGPHPAAAALRVRHAMTQGLKYGGMLSFGTQGDNLFMGLHYKGGEGDTIILRTLGLSNNEPIELEVSSGRNLTVVDSFGNSGIVPIGNGKAILPVSQMPVYLRLVKGQSVKMPQYEFGRNFAERARITYSGRTTRDMTLLNNGIFETMHEGNPDGGVDGAKIWIGKLYADEKGIIKPEALDVIFDMARTVDKVVLFTMRPDSSFCSLLDFDIQCHTKEGGWKTIQEVRSSCPPSDPTEIDQISANTWILDNNIHLVRFMPVTTEALRIVARRTTHGYFPDAAGRSLKTLPPQALMLREIEAYGPTPEPAVELTAPETEFTRAFANAPIRITVRNRGENAFSGGVRIGAPAGWSVSPVEKSISLAPSQTGTLDVVVTPPAVIPAGSTFFDAELVSDKGVLLDRNWMKFGIKPEFRILPLRVQTVTKGSQPFALRITNNGKTPMSGKVKLSLTGPAPRSPLIQQFGPIMTNSPVATVVFNAGDIRLANQNWTAEYEVTVDGISDNATLNLAVRSWIAVGPFECDFEKDFGPENKLDTSKSLRDDAGNQRHWQEVASEPDGYLNVLPLFQPNENCSMYAATWVKSPRAQIAELAVGSDEGIKVWVNGKLVIENDADRSAAPEQDKSKVQLKAGWNALLVKTTQTTGSWGFHCVVLDPETGWPLPGLAYSPRP